MLLRIRARNASRWISYPNMRPCLTFGSPSGLENACVVPLVVGAHNPGPVALIRPSATFSRSAGEAVIRPRLKCGRLLGLRFQVMGQHCMCGSLFSSPKRNLKAGASGLYLGQPFDQAVCNATLNHVQERRLRFYGL